MRTLRGQVQAGDSQEVLAWTRVVAGEGVRVTPAKVPLWVPDYTCQLLVSNTGRHPNSQASTLTCKPTCRLPPGPLHSDASETSLNNRCTTELPIAPLAAFFILVKGNVPSQSSRSKPSEPSRSPLNLLHLMPSPSAEHVGDISRTQPDLTTNHPSHCSHMLLTTLRQVTAAAS